MYDLTSKEKGLSKGTKSPEKTKGPEEESDPLSEAIGEFGRWQLCLTFLLSLFNFPCTWHIFAVTFQAPQVDFWCSKPKELSDWSVEEWRNASQLLEGKNGTIEYDACSVRNNSYSNYFNNSRPCNEWEFDKEEFHSTIISEWNLVCEKAELINVAEMMFLVGVALGGLCSGMISDRFGRKKTLMGSLALQVSIGVAIAFVPWFEAYLVLRFLLGIISVSIVFSGFVICMEVVGGKWRTISGVSYLMPVPLGYISIAGIAYAIRRWNYQQLAISLPGLLLFALWWIVPESPRWLLAMGREEEFLEVIQKAAKANKRAVPQNLSKFLQHKPKDENANERKATVVDLFRTPTIRKCSFILYLIWFTVYLVYYGLVLNLSNIGGDIYVNTVLSGAVELPAIAISIFVLLKLGRRWPLCLTIMGSGVACLLTLTVPIGDKSKEWVTIMFAMIGKFAISASNATLPVFTAELFPTVIRNLGVGSSNMAAGIALMLTPYLWNLSSIEPRLPMGILGAMGIIGGSSVLLLPETSRRPLLETIEQGEEWARDQKSKKRRSNGNANVSPVI